MKKQTIKLGFATVIILVALGLVSCSESDSEEVDFPIALYAQQLTKVSDIRMFTAKGEITDPNKIISFTEDAESFNPPDDVKDSEAAIIFHSRDSIIFDKERGEGYRVQKNENLFLFYSQPYVAIASIPLYFQMQKHKAELTPVILPGGQYFITKTVIPAYGSYKKLEMCLLSYKISQNSHSSSTWAWGTAFNEFDPKVINSLNEADTLAIQEYRIVFRAK